MERYGFFIGIDVSKPHLDFVARTASASLGHLRVPNTVEGVKDAVGWMRGFAGFKARDCLACMEHTGIYCEFALRVLHAKGFGVWLEVAERIRNGSGSLMRGKSDKVDAGRIADYAHLFRANARLWEPPRPEVLLLADLMAARNRLVDACVRLRVPVAEVGRFKAKAHSEAVRLASSRTLASAARDLRDLEARIMQVVQGDASLARLYALVTSVVGIGFVTGVTLIVATNEFKDISDPRKLACHAGCAPFEHSSGSSVRRRSKVSHKADKRLKSLLHLCAVSAVGAKGEIRDYFERKVASGKCKFVVFNAVRNKLLHRVCACVREGRQYSREPRKA